MHVDLPDDSYGAYLFDCDGTLIDSMPVHFKGWAHALKTMEVDFEFPIKLYNDLAGTDTRRIVEILNETFNLTLDADVLLGLKREYYLSNLPNLKRIDIVADFAVHIAKTHPVAVVTGGHPDIVSQSLAAVGLLDLFPVLISHQDVENGKPAPDMFLLAAERLGVDPTTSVVFEDGQLGIDGAHAAGMDTVYIPSNDISG